jgi:hypothetical protein
MEVAPYRAVDPPVAVLVDDNGSIWPGFALGWRRDRVYVTYNSGVGMRHLLWLHAVQVHRAADPGNPRPPVTTRARAPFISDRAQHRATPLR